MEREREIEKFKAESAFKISAIFDVEGKKLEAEAMEEHSHWYDHPLLWAIAGLTIGVLLMFLVMRRRNRKLAASIIVLGLLIPTATMNPGFAHEGEEHGARLRPLRELAEPLRQKEEEILPAAEEVLPAEEVSQGRQTLLAAKGPL